MHSGQQGCHESVPSVVSLLADTSSLAIWSANMVVTRKSRRSWKPNVQEKRLFSYIFNCHIRVKVTTHALRCIDKAGGID
ncbi:Ribosomal protein [Quillaja saponaria]|uniref:Ribosomal protein n=1 Tax=Quillaja saponaria TaxID=32244 RepID=A0AAD7PK70_QUISA|nr:Ribosomal protein [Quillaja saponaria]